MKGFVLGFIILMCVGFIVCTPIKSEKLNDKSATSTTERSQIKPGGRRIIHSPCTNGYGSTNYGECREVFDK